VRFHPLIADANQALALQPVVGHPGLGAQRARQVPLALRAHARPDRGPCPGPQGQQVANAVAHAALLLPVAQAHPTAQPVVQLGDRPVVIRDAEVAQATSDVFGELLESVGHRRPPLRPVSLRSR